MGKTVAELGNRNAPTDILSFSKEGKEYLLVANSNRTLMKIDPKDIENQEGLTKPLEKRFGTVGVEFAGIAEVYVQHMDNLDDDNIVWIQRMSNGNLKLRTISVNRL